MGSERDAILSRRAKFVAAAIAATGMTVVVHDPPADAQMAVPCLSVARPHSPEQDARRALVSHDWARAIVLYRALPDLSSRPELQMELAQAYEGAGDFRAARDVYLDVARRAEDGGAPLPGIEAKARAADAKLGELLVTSNDPNMQVLVDGTKVAMADGVPARVNPGRHVVAVIGSLGDEQRREVEVTTGGRADVEFKLAFDSRPRVCLQNMDVREVAPPESRPPSGCGCRAVGSG